MKRLVMNKRNVIMFCSITVTAVLITVTGILFKQSFLRILPLYISLFVGMMQSQANRYANLLGGMNSLLYMLVYLYLGLYASAGYCLLFSFPIQIATFIRWGKREYGKSTMFREMSTKGRLLTAGGFAAAFICLFTVLKAAGSSYQLLDNLSSLMGILISVLTMFAFVEYTWLMLPSGILSIILNTVTMAEHPEQITYVVFSVYSFICVSRQFFTVRRLYAEQRTDDHHV